MNFSDAAATPAASHSDAGVTTIRILLVDDEPLVLNVYADVLRAAGWSVEVASDGFSAIEKLKGEHYDVIVSDIAMPGMDGAQFLRAVREFDLDVPVILNTGNPTLDTAVRAVEHGAFRYLMKPVSIKVLRDTVQRAARLHGLARLKRQALQLLGETGTAPGDRAGLESRYRRALEGLWVAFQPIVSQRERRVHAYEALVRTKEPTLQAPGMLFDSAERLGGVHDLDRRVRGMVTDEVVAAPLDAEIFINLHPLDLVDEELYAAGAPLSAIAGRVVLEITERASLEGIRDLGLRVQSLRALGYRIAVDDLGAGYAGLGILAQLEPDIAKIDMSLVRGVDHLATKRLVIRSMAALCADLGIRLVAEGVETAGERDALLDCGCDLLQGFLFAAPGPGFARPASY